MDVLGFGFCNIDLVARVKEDFLARHGIGKGLESPMDDLSLGRIRAELESFEALPGGCIANTLCGLSLMGVDTRFYGKVGNDEFESLFRASFRDYGVAFDVEHAQADTSQCAVLITPDGERSFAQTIGASFMLNESDIDWNALENARILYAEIYTCEFNGDTKFFERLCDTAIKHDIPVYIKVIDREYGARYADLLHHYAQKKAIKLIVGNHDNLPSITGGYAPTHVRDALTDWPCDVLMTAASKGGTYFADSTPLDFSVEALPNPKNSSGAGDQFMAGFIAATLDNRPIEECLAFGGRTARAILTHDQPRPPLTVRQSIRF